MPFYGLYLYNSHFHTVVTKDKKNDIDGRYFVHSKLFSLTVREIFKKYIYSNALKLKITTFILEIKHAS